MWASPQLVQGHVQGTCSWSHLGYIDVSSQHVCKGVYLGYPPLCSTNGLAVSVLVVFLSCQCNLDHIGSLGGMYMMPLVSQVFCFKTCCLPFGRGKRFASYAWKLAMESLMDLQRLNTNDGPSVTNLDVLSSWERRPQCFSKLLHNAWRSVEYWVINLTLLSLSRTFFL